MKLAVGSRELGDEGIVASGAGERLGTELGGAGEVAGHEHVASVIHGNAISHFRAGSASLHRPQHLTGGIRLGDEKVIASRVARERETAKRGRPTKMPGTKVLPAASPAESRADPCRSHPMLLTHPEASMTRCSSISQPSRGPFR